MGARFASPPDPELEAKRAGAMFCLDSFRRYVEDEFDEGTDGRYVLDAYIRDVERDIARKRRGDFCAITDEIDRVHQTLRHLLALPESVEKVVVARPTPWCFGGRRIEVDNHRLIL